MTTTAHKQKNKTQPVPDNHTIGGLIGWSYVDGANRGVVAIEDIKSGTEIECSPVLVTPTDDYTAVHGRKTVVDDYLLAWEDKGEEIEYAIGFGYLMLYNHSANANADFRWNYPAKEITVFVTRDVKAGEELTIDYAVPLWFQPRELVSNDRD